MNYELAKQLKDAGFRQSGDGGFLSERDGWLQGEQTILRGDVAYIPTLSELIDVCGEKFKGLVQIRNSPQKFHSIGIGVMGEANAPGSTPEEAVARLWLALNQK